jgi:DNA-directed RNA polymerase subunit K
LALTRFEKARILGARALQISMGAPSVLPSETTADALGLATREFASGITPLGDSRFRDALD